MMDSQEEYILEEEGFGKGVGVTQLVCWKQQKPQEKKSMGQSILEQSLQTATDVTDRQPRSVYECNGTSCSTGSK